jgi:hypothetical protein
LNKDYIDAITGISNHKSLYDKSVINNYRVERWQVVRVLQAIELYEQARTTRQQGEDDER